MLLRRPLLTGPRHNRGSLQPESLLDIQSGSLPILRAFFADRIEHRAGTWFETSDYGLACLLVAAGKLLPLDARTEKLTAQPQAVWGTAETRQPAAPNWANWRQ